MVMVSVLLLSVGGAVIVWGIRTGQLTIFGDDATVMNADLAVTGPLDLEKGAAAGDHQLRLEQDLLRLQPSARSGNALFVVGQREVITLHRIVPAVTGLASSDGVTFSFAGSIDGVQFDTFSPPQAVAFDTVNGQRQVRPFELDFLIAPESRFVRVKVVLERTNEVAEPTFAGFTLNYSQRDSLTSDTGLLVNGSPAASPANTEAPPPGRPANLVVTGPGAWLLLAALSAAAAGLGFRRLRNRKGGNRGRATNAG